MNTSSSRGLRFPPLYLVVFAVALVSCKPQPPAGDGYQLETIATPDAGAVMFNVGHHFRITLTKESAVTPVELPVVPAAFDAVDQASLRLAYYDRAAKRYTETFSVALSQDGKAKAAVARSGEYSLFGLPAAPLARDAIAHVCAIEGTFTKERLEPICTVIYCPAFEQLGSLSGEPGLAAGGLPGGTGNVCERCTGLRGRTAGGIAECGLDFGVPLPKPVQPILIDVIKPKWPWPLLYCQTRPTIISDPSDVGPYPVASTEYNFTDAFNIPPNDLGIDVWATVRYPGASAGANAPIAAGTTKFPLVVYLHGNHGIWINSSGQHVCGSPTGTPVPNHDGYNYILERLASRGLIAVSINANDLNCKSGRIFERGKLILEHLRRWRDWNDPSKPDPTFGGRFHNRVDMTRIGLAGHSRGGEAVVAAYLENKSAGLGYGIKAVHSIAPVDSHALVLEDVPYYVLLPAADGDVSNLAGAKIYDRAAPRANPDKMPKKQSMLYGANHNWFNTVWFQDEGAPAFGPGADRITQAEQQSVARVLGVAFFRQHLQNFGTAQGLFTGSAKVAALDTLKIYRSYQDPAHRNVDDFEDTPPNALLNSLGGTNTLVSLSPLGEYPFRQGSGAYNATFYHDTSGLIAGWNAATDAFLVSVPEAYKDMSSYRYLSFRLTQVFDNGAINPVGGMQDLDVGLEDKLGNRVFLQVGQYDVIPYPYQRPYATKSMLQTIRLSLACYGCSSVVGVNTKEIAKVYFRFNRRNVGLIGVDSVQFSR